MTQTLTSSNVIRSGPVNRVQLLHPCPTCGREIAKAAKTCPHCGGQNGVLVSDGRVLQAVQKDDTMLTVALVFTIIGALGVSFLTFGIGLLWCIPAVIVGV